MESGLRFFLRYVEAHGAVVLEEEDQALVHLTDSLRQDFALPQELALTSDAEVAQEGGQLLVIAGHPLLEAAAERVLQQGDAGWAALAWPRTTPPAKETLLEGLRGFYPVEHGRVDIVGEPEPLYVPLLQIGALVSFTGENRFLERMETLVDAIEALALPPAAAARILQAPAVPQPEALSVLAPRFEEALGVGLREVERQAAGRAQALAAEAQKALGEELERAEAYYQAQLQQIAHRRESAAAERQGLYDDQARVTSEEALRRRGEIEEKYGVRGSVRPFRLHLLLAPALHLDLEVRRGERRYPLACNYLLEAQTFLRLRCPSCGEAMGLVAGRQELGCLSCQGAKAESADPPPQPAMRPAETAKKAPASPPARLAQGERPQQTQQKPKKDPAAKPKDRPQVPEAWRRWGPLPELAQEFFSGVLAGGAPGMPIARNSPLDIALRFFGWRGLHLVLDLPYPDVPAQGSRLLQLNLLEGHHLTGRLQVGHVRREFTLLLQGSADEPTLWEVLPCRLSSPYRLAPLNALGHQLEAMGEMAEHHGAPGGLDEVEWLFLSVGAEHWQFSLMLRAFSVWRRAGRKAPGISARAAASGVFQIALDESGLTANENMVAETFGADPLRTRQAAEAIAQRLPRLLL